MKKRQEERFKRRYERQLPPRIQSQSSLFVEVQAHLSTHSIITSPQQLILTPELMPKVTQGQILVVTDQKSKTKFVCKASRKIPEGISTASLLKNIPDLYALDCMQKLKCNIKVLTEDESGIFIQILEVTVREGYFSRRDQFKFISAMQRSTVYSGKQINYSGCKLLISGIVINNFPELSGVVTGQTQFVFRSQCAKLRVMVQLSRQFFSFSQGQLGWQKMKRFLNVFFYRNSFLQNKHKFTVVLYARFYYPQFRSLDEAYVELIKAKKSANESKANMSVAFKTDGEGKVCQDVFRSISFRADYHQNWNILGLQIWRKSLQIIFNLNWIQGCRKWITPQFFTGYDPFQCPIHSQIAEARMAPLFECLAVLTEIIGQARISRDINKIGNSVLILSCGWGEYESLKHMYKSAKNNVLNKNVSCALVVLNHMYNKKQLIVKLAQQNNEESIFQEPPLIYWCLQKYCYLTPFQTEFNQRKEGAIDHRRGTLTWPDILNIYSLSEKELSCGHAKHSVFEREQKIKKKVKVVEWIQVIPFHTALLLSHTRLFDKIPYEPRLLLECDFDGQQEFVSDQPMQFCECELLQRQVEEFIMGRDVRTQVTRLQSVGDQSALLQLSCVIQSQFNIFEKDYRKRPQSSSVTSLDVQIKRQKRPKANRLHERRWENIRKQSKINYYSFLYSPDIKKNFKGYCNGLKTPKQDADQIFKNIQLQYYWKLILLPPLLPLYTKFLLDQAGRHRVNNWTVTNNQNMTLEEVQSELISLRLYHNYQLVQTKNVVDQFGVGQRLQGNSTVLVRGKKQQIIKIDRTSKNIVQFQPEYHLQVLDEASPSAVCPRPHLRGG